MRAVDRVGDEDFVDEVESPDHIDGRMFAQQGDVGVGVPLPDGAQCGTDHQDLPDAAEPHHQDVFLCGATRNLGPAPGIRKMSRKTLQHPLKSPKEGNRGGMAKDVRSKPRHPLHHKTRPRRESGMTQREQRAVVRVPENPVRKARTVDAARLQKKVPDFRRRLKDKPVSEGGHPQRKVRLLADGRAAERGVEPHAFEDLAAERHVAAGHMLNFPPGFRLEIPDDDARARTEGPDRRP